MSAFSRQQLVVAIAFGTAALAASPAVGQTASSDLSLNVTVQNSCSIENASIDFGTYTSNQPDDLDAEGSIAYDSCPSDATITLSGGEFGNVSDRRLIDGSQTLPYQLFQDASRSTAWGADSVTVPNEGTGTIVVYGRIAGGEFVPAGDYSDSVQITVTF